MVTLKPLFGFLAYHRISLKELAERTGLSYQTVMTMRRNDTFTLKSIDKICFALNLGIKDVMRFEEESL